MKAMILAAGRGERMRPLTDHTPKPLIQAGSKRLIEYHLYNLAAAGFKQVIINVAWLGQKIIEEIGEGDKYNLEITYSNEGAEALETGGGIINALPLLGDDPFLVVNGDVWTDYPFKKLYDFPLKQKAHLVLVENPQHNKHGDFSIRENLLVNNENDKFTFSGVGVYSRAFFQQDIEINKVNKKQALGPMIRKLINQGMVSGELYKGKWLDVGTEERLAELIQWLSRS